MSLCRQLRPYLDGEGGPLLRWRMARHLPACPNCSAQRAAEAAFLAQLRAEAQQDSPAEAAAIARVTLQWVGSASVSGAVAPASSRRPFLQRVMTASAAVGLAAVVLGVGATVSGKLALASVAGAMKKVQRLHVKMQVAALGQRYEAWTERGKGARLEEWTGNRRTMVVVDDGKKLLRYYPGEGLLRQSESQYRELLKEARGFHASRLLEAINKGELLEGQSWVGEPLVRRVRRLKQAGAELQRIDIALKNGMFEKMVLLADRATDRVTEASLYSHDDSPDDRWFIRATFDYPAHLTPWLFQLQAPTGTPVRRETSDLVFP